MGTVITFPAERRSAPVVMNPEETCTIIILPVIRIERHQDSPSPHTGTRGGQPRARRAR